MPDALRYFPAVCRSLHHSPVDALVALGVPRDECLDLVTSSWGGSEDRALLAWIDGGRPVAALARPGGLWAACNAYLEYASPDPGEAARRLAKVLKRGRRGWVGRIGASQLAPEGEGA
ncbi:hypothetical protein [Azospira inquinata]|uniref:Uncharacterized protein n=1 Tax=Azospira inquinata TaxID=2785627 RepID=A0A975SLL5_9RHOO|nr:hypothetical protein [Azospira inquinata]QWT46574.1 hypothetical protein J8L76_02370 [Azospira inquinata]QWT48104.1 hypothetical protein Azoinq_09495 [Azospira inquinata]